MRSRGRPAIAVGVLLGLVLTGLGGAPAANAGQVSSPPDNPVRPGKPAPEALPRGQVTLLTGDRVTIDQAGQVQTQAGPGRKVRFEVQQGRGRLYVVPSDVSSAVAVGKLDRALFEVAGLIRQGLDDKRTKDLPLLVTYEDRAKTPSFAKAKPGRQLPSINGAALTVAKQDAATFLTQLTGGRTVTGVKKVWLDAKFKPTLDTSVPQVGAPAAWQAGFTGTGVTVAVLDTGIDSTHADLKTQLAGQRNFTEEADGDKVGHGTHVASTIAGTGATAGGKYKGVAPGAKLYDGKVCEANGCPLSAIVAGMEWAATEVKAKVVNMSLGGPDDPEVDPVEEALARLTEQTGTLFVVAAGNDGEAGPGTVGSPGSMASALTVGAVDKQDKLAIFSSRGPVLDGTVKPDLTAPGVAIVAARAAGTDIGTPVDEHYTSLNGTSMATPHVAGAVAILAQQHPDWKAARLKTQLMSAAKPIEGQSGYEQGVGRLDVANAVTSSVVAEPGSLWFGKAAFPHQDDKPVTKTLTYRNTGDQPVDLALSATLLGPDSLPAPAGAIKLGARTLTVPAGGTAVVPVTLDTNHAGPDGGYSGQVVAKAGERTVTASIAIDKEVPSFDLTIKSIGLDGKPAESSTILLPKTAWAIDLPDSSGTVKTRLTSGEYAIRTNLEIAGATYRLIQPFLALTADTTVVMDARRARPLQVSTKQPGAVLVTGTVRVVLPVEWEWMTSLYFTDQAGLFTAQVGPPAKDVMGSVATSWARRNADGTFDNSPYQLNQVNKTPGRFPTGLKRVVDPAKLVRVDQTLHATSGRRGEVNSSSGYNFAGTIDYDLPARRQVFHDPGSTDDPATEVRTVMSEFEPGPERVPMTDAQHLAKYLGGQRYRERYNAGVFAPGPNFAWRQLDMMGVILTPLADAEGKWGGSTYGSAADLSSTKLFRNGELVVEYDDRFGWVNPEGLPAEPATYQLVSVNDRHSVSRFSTKVEHVWTFRSAADGEREISLPLLGIKYLPVVDDRNETPRKPVTRMAVVITPQPGTPLPRIDRFAVEYQGAPGSAWKAAKLVRKAAGQYVAEFPTPAGDSVSLRANVVDGEGNSTVQTVTDAIRLNK